MLPTENLHTFQIYVNYPLNLRCSAIFAVLNHVFVGVLIEINLFYNLFKVVKKRKGNNQVSEKFVKLIAVESSEQCDAFLRLRTFLSRLSAFTTYVGNCLGYLMQINF